MAPRTADRALPCGPDAPSAHSRPPAELAVLTGSAQRQRQPALPAWRQPPEPPGRRFRRTAAASATPARLGAPGLAARAARAEPCVQTGQTLPTTRHVPPPWGPGRPPAPGWPGERSAPAARRQPEPRARAARARPAGSPAAVALGPGIPGPEPLEAAFRETGIPRAGAPPSRRPWARARQAVRRRAAHTAGARLGRGRC